MSRELRQSTAQTELIGPFLDVGDGFTEETGLTTPPTEISKDGGTYGTGPAGGTHDSDGWYPVAFTTAHTDTLGSLMLKSHDNTTHLPVWHEFMVITANEYDSKYGTDVREADVTQWLGTAVPAPGTAGVPSVDVLRWDTALVATPTIAGVPEVDLTHMIGVNQSAIDLKDFADDGYNPTANAVTAIDTGGITSGSYAAGAIDAAAIATDAIDAAALAAGAVNKLAAAIGVQKNQAFSDLEFLMILSSDGQSPATGLTVTGERSIDGGAYAGVSGSIAEVSDGTYQFDALAADMNGDTITFKFSSATALDTFVFVKTTP